MKIQVRKKFGGLYGSRAILFTSPDRINKVKTDLCDNSIAAAKEKFNAKYGHKPKVYDVVISDGSRRLE